MHFAAFFTAAVVWTATVQGAVFQKHPTPESTKLLIEELTKNRIKNPTKPPAKEDPKFTPWSGVAIPKAPSGGVFNFVSAKFTIPNLLLPKNDKEAQYDHGVVAWVGIDGFSTDTLLQTGVYLQREVNGKIKLRPFYQWLDQEQYSIYINEFKVDVGDVIAMRVESSENGNKGVITLENETKQTHFTKTLKAKEISVLTGTNVEWIVEQYFNFFGGYSIPPDFGSVTFTDCVAKTTDGRSFSPLDGVIVNYSPKLLPRVDPPGTVTVSYFYG